MNGLGNLAAERSIGFFAQPHRSLCAFGIVGYDPEVFFIQGDLLLRDSGGEVLDIQPGEVDRLRLGKMATKSQVYYVARLFLHGQPEPLLLMPKAPRCPYYAETMRRFAHAVARERGLEHVERGLTTATAWAMFLAVFAITLGASALALTVWSKEFGLVGAAMFTVVMAAILGLVAWEMRARELPKPVVSFDEVDRFLPLQQD